MGKNQHVVPHGDGWAVRGEGNERATSVHRTQSEATDAARQIATNQRSEVLIHGRNGQIRERNSYVRTDSRIASSRSSFFRHRIVDLKVGRSRHFIRQKCRFSPPHGEAARHSRLPFSGGPGSSAWRKSPNIQALPEGATTVADRGFNAAGSQRTSRCSTVGRLHDWHQAKRCAVGSSLPNPKRCAVGKSEAMRCRLAPTETIRVRPKDEPDRPMPHSDKPLFRDHSIFERRCSSPSASARVNPARRKMILSSRSCIGCAPLYKAERSVLVIEPLFCLAICDQSD